MSCSVITEQRSSRFQRTPLPRPPECFGLPVFFAFCMSTPIRDVCVNPTLGGVQSQLTADYFKLSVLDDGESVEYQLP